MTRGGFECTKRFPSIATAIQSMPAETIILDGELVAIGEDGLPDFGALHRGERRNLRFYAFDLLQHAGTDVRHEPLTTRRALLAEQLRTGSASGYQSHRSVR